MLVRQPARVVIVMVRKPEAVRKQVLKVQPAVRIRPERQPVTEAVADVTGPMAVGRTTALAPEPAVGELAVTTVPAVTPIGVLAQAAVATATRSVQVLPA